MKTWMFICLLLFALPFVADAEETIAFIEGSGVHLPTTDTDPCPPSVLALNHDGSSESGFTWTYLGIQEPDYGALAEGYPASSGGIVCGIELMLSRWATMNGVGEIDLYVWEYDTDADDPGSVLAVTTAVPVSGVAYWPGISTVDLDCQDAVVTEAGFFVGYWPRSFAGVAAEFGCVIDVDGPGGVPRTNIAPGIGYPTGWQNLTVAGYEIAAWGIGGWVASNPTPIDPTSWGSVKALYK